MSNNKYIIKTFYARQPDGSNKQIKVYGKTEKEALQKLAQVQAEYRLGLRTLNNNTPFAQWAREWLATYKASKVGKKQLHDLTARLENFFIPRLGALPLTEIKAAHIQRALNDLADKSISTQKKHYDLINSVLKKAVENDLISKNPMSGVELPRGAEEQPRRSLTPDELAYYRHISAKHPYGVLFDLSLDCGLRPQEARALTWANVDLHRGIITVNSAVKASSRTVGVPKSKAGVRQIPIPRRLLERLQAMPRRDLGLIFRTESGKPYSDGDYSRRWHGFLRQMDIAAGAYMYRNRIIMHAIDPNITPYYLRHTYATTLAERGVPMKTAQVLLGHSSIAVTAKVYTHFTEQMLEDARQALERD